VLDLDREIPSPSCGAAAQTKMQAQRRKRAAHSEERRGEERTPVIALHKYDSTTAPPASVSRPFRQQNPSGAVILLKQLLHLHPLFYWRAHCFRDE